MNLDINISSEKSSYCGKFAPLSEGYEQVENRNERKRRRHSTGATSTGYPSHPDPQQRTIPSKEVFSCMNVEDKLDTMFGLMINIQQTSLQVGQINSFCYLQHSVNEVNEARMRLLEYKSIQLETKLLSTNLIINGIQEVPNEDTYSLIDSVNHFIDDFFNIRNVGIVDAFRIGRKNVRRHAGQNISRPILVKFVDQRAVDRIMANVRDLKGSNYGVSRDYPKEIREARKQLWPEFKEARNRHGFRNVQFLYPAAIKVNGDIIKDLFPGWYPILQGSRNSNVTARVEERHRHNVSTATKNILANIQESDNIPSMDETPAPIFVDHPHQASKSDTDSDSRVVTNSPTSDVATNSHEAPSQHTPSENAAAMDANNATNAAQSGGATNAVNVSLQPGHLLSVHQPIIQHSSTESLVNMDVNNAASNAANNAANVPATAADT